MFFVVFFMKSDGISALLSCFYYNMPNYWYFKLNLTLNFHFRIKKIIKLYFLTLRTLKNFLQTKRSDRSITNQGSSVWCSGRNKLIDINYTYNQIQDLVRNKWNKFSMYGWYREVKENGNTVTDRQKGNCDAYQVISKYQELQRFRVEYCTWRILCSVLIKQFGPQDILRFH